MRSNRFRPSRIRLVALVAVPLAFALASASAAVGALARQGAATHVDPADLARREDLVGSIVVVDDRIRFFQNHPRVGYDELYLKRTPIAFRLPAALRPDSAPRNPAVVVQGKLTREGSRLFVDVTELNLQPSDQERFDKAVASLPARDFEHRRAWGRWAAKRAKDFGDDSLAARARAVEAEALRIEAESKRLTVDAPREWLTLAQQGREQGVAEPAPSALAHRAFRSMLNSATEPAALESLQGEVAAFFPTAPKDTAPAAIPGELAARYDQDPAGAYRSAPAEQRKPLDRKLWADVVQKLLETRASGDVRSALQIVDQAEELVPDRPRLATRLIEQAQARARADLAALRLSEVKSVGALLEDRAKDPASALALYRDWLAAQRDRLGEADAEGAVILAGHYETLLKDSEGSRRLLERAWKISPESETVSDAFKVRGYRRAGDDWVKDEPASVAAVASAPVVDQGLRGMSPAEVRASMGIEPVSKSVVATKGRVVLQWVFNEARQKRYVNFLHVPGGQAPRVVSDYFLPR